VRLFAGIALDDATRRACATVIEELQRAGFAAKYERAEKLHLTLAFLGNVDAQRYDGVVGVLDDSAAATPPFELIFDKAGAFPHERKPRVVYVGARDQGRRFRELCARMRDGYGELGFTFKDDAVAHVTIARVKDSHRPLPLVDVPPIRMQVTALTLFESLHDKEKNSSRYAIRATSRLTPCG
jgi:2'-5' RNA ligase